MYATSNFGLCRSAIGSRPPKPGYDWGAVPGLAKQLASPRSHRNPMTLVCIRNPEIQKSRNPEIQKTRNQEIQKSRTPEIQKSRNPEIQKSRDPEIQKSVRDSGQHCRGSEDHDTTKYSLSGYWLRPCRSLQDQSTVMAYHHSSVTQGGCP